MIPLKVTVEQRPKSGVESTFYRINKRKGVKIFKNKREALKACRTQVKAWRRKIGPAVYEKDGYTDPAEYGYAQKFGVMSENGKGIEIRYGHYTQVVRTRSDMNRSKFRKMYANQIRNLKQALNKIDAGSDMHNDNVGFIGNKMVCIDFGHYSRRNR
jgi:hypothetical protein